ncbi:MAG: hypothetical protein AAFO74_01550 [Pseudomonadota bacterium]
MRKQILAALACIGLMFTTWIIPWVGIVMAGIAGGFREALDQSYGPGAGVVMMPFILAAISALCAFLALFYLKILYGSIAFAGLSAFWLSLLLVINVPIWPAIVGSLASLAAAGVYGAAAWSLLRWIYVDDAIDIDIEKEFA